MALLLLLLPMTASAQAPVRAVRAGDFEALTLSLPGFLVKSAGVNGPGGAPGVALLLASQKNLKGPKSLLFFDPEKRSLQTLASGLHEEVNTVLGFDLAGDGALAPVAGMPGVLFAPAGGGGARKVLDLPAADLRSVSGLGGPVRPWIPVAHTGVLELLGGGPGGLVRRASFPLPVRAEKQRWGLRLVSPPVTLLPGDPALFAVGPEASGRRRLQTVLVPADGSPAIESWSLLPGEERLSMDRRYLRLDGRPVLAAVTVEKIGLLAKKRVRVFNLELDRSRKGTGPAFAVETDCPLWWPLDSAALDADGDGRQDLVLSHPGGLRGREMLVTAYRGLGGGRFEREPRRWKLNDEPTDWLYGPDLTGDGVPDLLVYVGDRLLLYPGDAKGSRPLAGRPLWSFAVSGAPKKEQRKDDDEDQGPSGDETLNPERDRAVESLELPGGGRITYARGAQADGRTVLTLVRRPAPGA
ncbi:MAG: FG-GAP repeat domain-containing protein [Thermoanaerobaculia bacterium]